MPSKRSVRKPKTEDSQELTVQAATGAPGAASGAIKARATGAPEVADTPTRRALWAALTGEPGATTAELARSAMMGKSTAAMTLAGFEKAGVAKRVASEDGDRWHPVTVDGPATADAVPVAGAASATEDGEQSTAAATEEAAPAQAESVPEPEAEAATATQVAVPQPEQEADDSQREAPKPAPAGDGKAKARMGRGQLRAMIAAHLQAHPDEEFTPFAMGKLMGHSSGAIANACENLVKNQVAVQTSDKPCRYRLASAG